jgi:hypothetical protein
MTVTAIKKKSTEVIELLEELLENAKKGELQELVILGRYGNNYTTYFTHTKNIPESVGILEILKNNQLLRAKT